MRSLTASNPRSTRIELLSVCIELSLEYASFYSTLKNNRKPSCMQHHHTGMLLQWLPLPFLLTKSKEVEDVARGTHPNSSRHFIVHSKCLLQALMLWLRGKVLSSNVMNPYLQKGFSPLHERLEKEMFSLPIQCLTTQEHSRSEPSCKHCFMVNVLTPGPKVNLPARVTNMSHYPVFALRPLLLVKQWIPSYYILLINITWAQKVVWSHVYWFVLHNLSGTV